SFIPFPSRFGVHPRSFDPPWSRPTIHVLRPQFWAPTTTGTRERAGWVSLPHFPSTALSTLTHRTCERGTTQAGTRPPSCRAQLRPHAHRGTCRRVFPLPLLTPPPPLACKRARKRRTTRGDSGTGPPSPFYPHSHARESAQGPLCKCRVLPPSPLARAGVSKGAGVPSTCRLSRAATTTHHARVSKVHARGKQRRRWGRGAGSTPAPLLTLVRARVAAAALRERGVDDTPAPLLIPARVREAAALVPRGEGADGTREREAALDSALAPLPRSRPLSPRFAPTLVYHSTGGALP
ncbi:hypothetical protein V8E53_001512, partial [Lactarius tabidus]